MRVVVIGGLGNFGARICKRLSQEKAFEIIATSRHRQDAGAANIPTAVLDIDHVDFAAQLKSLAPDLVIHCAGPFQGQDYRVALASLGCKAHYVDLADGRDFVAGFAAAVGPAATSAGRLAVSGASTLPALSSAVIDSMRATMRPVSAIEIDIVIAPGQHAPRGVATLAAVLGYAGQAFQWRQDGAWRTVYGWQELKRERFSFGSRLAAACDVPDLVLLPDRYPGIRTVTFRAALEVPVQHLALWAVAVCRRMGLPIRVAQWATAFDRIGTWLNWLGTDTGGMTVRVAGADSAGQPHWRCWELVAGANHGPEIPCMAAVILARKLHRGDEWVAGAKVCMGMITLGEFEQEFTRWDIHTSESNS